jgi:hypothetical protein
MLTNKSFNVYCVVHFRKTASIHKRIKKGKAIPVTGRGRPLSCETSSLERFLDNRLTDGGEVVSLTRWPPFTPRKIPGTHYC